MTENPVIRFEKFGGIISTEDPPVLAFVDRDYIRKEYKKESPLWIYDDSRILSAPVEAHYAVTNYCPAECPGCYMGSENNQVLRKSDDKGFERALKIADSLVNFGIFHVALGGGESFSLPWFTDLASYFRENGVIPNVTTSGLFLEESLMEKCRVFGQINISIDGLKDHENPLRSAGHFKQADAALRLLRKNGIRAGINSIITRYNFDFLEDIIRYAKGFGLTDIEFLRFKPAGRGKDIYNDMKLTREQGRSLFPQLKSLAKRYRIHIKLDCSFTPFVCCHKPSKRVLKFFSILGCDAGNWLVGVDPSGNVSPCSFIGGEDLDYRYAGAAWNEPETFSLFREWDLNAKGACSRCRYLSICKGGCHAVSKFISGSYREPDPECPEVMENLNRSARRFQVNENYPGRVVAQV